MHLHPTLISIIEVLMVLVPALLSVAFVTVAERKTMASMQRRVGPNFVGVYGTLQPLNRFTFTFTRQFHTSRELNNLSLPPKKRGAKNIVIPKVSPISDLLFLLTESIRLKISKAIDGIYRDRVSPVIAYSDSILYRCSNLLDPKEKGAFLGKLGNLGGLYLIQYKYDRRIFYIGRTTCFRSRFNAHIRSANKDKFHLFGRLVGWSNVNFIIIKVCPVGKQGILENYFLQKYLPILNTAYTSQGSETSVVQTLSSLLESKKPGALNSSQGIGITIWVYGICKKYIDKTPVAKYSSVNQASKSTGTARATIIQYLNTNVPLKGLLYYSNPLTAFDSAFKVASDAVESLSLHHSAAKKVWAYNAITLELINGKPFSSIGEASRFFELLLNTVLYFIDRWSPENSKALYFFSRPLTDAEIKKLIALYKNKGNQIFFKVKVWAYNAQTLELITGLPFLSMQLAADYFGVDYRTIQYHLDTKLASWRNGVLVYFFTSELSSDLKSELTTSCNTEKPKLANNAVTQVWVYNKEEDGSIKLYNEDMPFKTKSLSCKTLKMSCKKLNKILDSNKEYKGLLFYKTKQEF